MYSKDVDLFFLTMSFDINARLLCLNVAMSKVVDVSANITVTAVMEFNLFLYIVLQA